MNKRTVRSATLALVVAALFSFGAPAGAHAFERPGRVKAEFTRVAARTVTSLASFLQGLGNWIANSSATICGDGSA
jgi:hypothetical protein